MSPREQGELNSEHRADVDGLRGVAVALVVLFHAWPTLLPGGFIGVDVFFVISGFVMSRLIAREVRLGQFSFSRFVVRRVNRLMPALLLVLVTTLAASMAWLSPALLALTAGHVASTLVLGSNLLLAAQSGYFDAASQVKPLLHVWSLSVEEQFYVVLGLTVALAWKRWRWSALPVVFVLALLSFMASVVWTRVSPQVAYFVPMTRAWELLAGVLISLIPPPRRFLNGLAALGALLLLIGAFAFDGTTPFPGIAALVPVAGAALLIFSGPTTFFASLLGVSRIVALGLVSYPLYLWHWPLLTLARLGTPLASHVVVSGVVVLVSLVLSALTTRLLEAPVRAKQRPATAFIAVGCSVVLFVLATRVVSEPSSWSARGPVAAELATFERTYDFQTDGRLTTCWLLDDAVGEFDETCLERTPADQPLLLVWGDSHAARLTAGLRAVQAERSTFRIAQRTRSSCPPVAGVGQRACQLSYPLMLEDVEALQPDVIVLAARWRMLSSLEPLVKTLEDVRRVAPKSRVVLVGPVPEWRGTLPWVLTLHGGSELPERLVPETFDLQRTFDAEVRDVAATSHVDFVSAMSSLCVDIEGCLVTMKRSPLMLSTWDYGHLTTPASKVIARRVLTPQ